MHAKTFKDEVYRFLQLVLNAPKKDEWRKGERDRRREKERE